MGTAQAMEHHPRHGVARGEDCVCRWHEACVDQVKQPEVLADSGAHASMIEPFDVHGSHGSTLPRSLGMRLVFQGRITAFVSLSTGSLSVSVPKIFLSSKLPLKGH